MKRFALLLAFSAATLIAGTFSGTGVVHDNKCLGPACATQCPVNKEAVYSLQTLDRAWVLSDAKTAARYAGKKVKITGTTQGNTITITSVTPAK
jgi:hypothetical protein